MAPTCNFSTQEGKEGGNSQLWETLGARLSYMNTSLKAIKINIQIWRDRPVVGRIHFAVLRINV